LAMQYCRVWGPLQVLSGAVLIACGGGGDLLNELL